jgi:hypothetical protein
MSTRDTSLQHDRTASAGAAASELDDDGDGDPALGAREDFWGSQHDETEDHQVTGHDPDPFDYKTERHGYVAHQSLRPHAPKYDPEALFSAPNYDHEPYELRCLADTIGLRDKHALHTENREIELTDPEIRVSKEMPDQFGNVNYGQTRHRSRVNTETGLVTGPYLGCLPEAEFLDIVHSVVDHLGHPDHYALSEDEKNELLAAAASRKADGDRDVHILSDLTERVTNAANNQ